jgi:peptide/nickel transport system substrate-binding protein
VKRLRFFSLSLLMITVLAGCSQGGGAPRGDGATTGGDGRPPAGQRARTLVMASRSEVPSLAAKPLQALGLTNGTTPRLFNAGLTLLDDRGNAQPYLAERLPQLNSDSWQLFPDGRMETTYKLRPNLTWHDGHPLTADDFVFSYEVYSTPDFGQAASPPISLMDEVVASDPLTLVIRWKRPYADAGALEARGGSAAPVFPPVPRHVFETAFRQGNPETFVANPAWSTEFVGLGPYKLDRWESGSFLEGVAFDGHALGRPKIERVRVTFIPDFNAVVANMLSGDVHINVDDSLRFQQGMIVKREWAQRNAGTVLVYPALWRWTQMQQRAELANPRSLLDVRIRKALAHTVDKQILSDVLFEGEGIMTETPVSPNAEYFNQVDAAASKYPYDPRRADQLFTEAGYSKGGDGVYTHPQLGRFSAELAVFQSPQNESEMAIMASTWRQFGLDIKEIVWPSVQARDNVLRATAPALTTTSGPPGEETLVEHNSGELPRPENRWTGSNRAGWSNPAFDRLAEQFHATLDRNQRAQLLVDMARIFSEDAAVISLYFNPTVTAYSRNLTGPKVVVPTNEVSWNVHEWSWTP